LPLRRVAARIAAVRWRVKRFPNWAKLQATEHKQTKNNMSILHDFIFRFIVLLFSESTDF
jgi:hypothetical protein